MEQQLYGSFYAEIISSLKSRQFETGELAKLKIKLCKKYGLKKIPTDIEILLNAQQDDLKDIKLITKPTRTISGVAVVALMSAPLSCPHGRCTFCPGGPGSVFGDTPQSYTGKEPSTMRAIRAGYDPYLIVFNRLEQYAVTGHNFDKVEVVVQGGTFPSYDESYQELFINNAFKAMNDFSEMFFDSSGLNYIKFKQFFELPGDIRSPERTKRIQGKILQIKNKNIGFSNNDRSNSNNTGALESEQLRNETAKTRCVALCIETKPDFSKEEHISDMLKLGTTRVELGVQTLHDEILARTNRGHTIKDTIEATQLLKDSFLKAGYHMMPGLPGSDREKDIDAFRELFENQDYKPDNLKIYPCMVMPGTELYEEWKKGEYKPLTTKEAAEIIVEGKKSMPEYCRVMRVQRDIPTYVTSAGVDRTNLRQYVELLKKEKGIECRCIRCREPKAKPIDFGSIETTRNEYESSCGTEIFIAAEDKANDLLLGFCRLRIPYKPFRKEITPETAGIRELHVFGPAEGLGLKTEGAVQHKGLGKALMAEAERTAKEEFSKKKLLVISGIGAREYYRKLGYEKEGAYMGKML
ncbi:tRNA uridine(34) 5-carboxymethylaminomethyl modification radical SAM/GNAT enzyme Elp3 [Candidatus Woesearchaeota archaeon]|nr:tRNA uridine(34) 5-carboxymethylaminomethyl modification radical SAM/GNAT enzyme Elp3 [Candidatus Woesearchaeota archaeon]